MFSGKRTERIGGLVRQRWINNITASGFESGEVFQLVAAAKRRHELDMEMIWFRIEIGAAGRVLVYGDIRERHFKEIVVSNQYLMVYRREGLPLGGR